MTTEELRKRIHKDEFVFTTSRSSGPGGQNVNKLNTKVELRFNVTTSSSLTEREKELIYIGLNKRINSNGELIIRSQSGRSQLQNRNIAIERLLLLLAIALTEKALRIPTTPTLQSETKRLDDKKKRGVVKKMRKDSGMSYNDI